MHNEHDHRFEFQGDNGIRYQPIVLGHADQRSAPNRPKAELELDLAAIQ
jgi:hypothetical protein